MTADEVYRIAIHLSDKEMDKLYNMLGKDVLPQIASQKTKRKPVVSDEEAIKYLLKNVFCKKQI
jgi:hypothetical protein